MTMTNEQADLIIAFNKTVRLLRATLGLAELLLADAELGRQPHRADVTREALTRCSQRSRIPLRANAASRRHGQTRISGSARRPSRDLSPRTPWTEPTPTDDAAR